MDENKKVKFNELQYNLSELFEKPPLFDIPPLRFNDLKDEEEQEQIVSNRTLWSEFHEIILGETRFSGQALDYFKQIRNRRILDGEDHLPSVANDVTG